MAVKVLLFDFDGTLLNTNDLIIQSFMHVLEERFPGQYSPKDCLKFMGPSLKQTFSDLTPGEEDEMMAKYRAWNEPHHDELVTEFPDVVSTLEQLKSMGIKLAIVSTKRNAMIDRGLNILGASHLFDVIVGTDDVQNVKPDPEPVLLALSRLGATKEDAIMIGDNSHDIEAAHNAGVRAAGVAWSIKGEQYLQQFNPEYILQHMKDLLDIVKEG
jgi:pyrophosphatase PpaX